MKLADWAAKNHLNYTLVRRMYKEGRMPAHIKVTRVPFKSGRGSMLLVDEPDPNLIRAFSSVESRMQSMEARLRRIEIALDRIIGYVKHN